MQIRKATAADADTIWTMLEPVFRAGETYAIDPDISKSDALAYWLAHHAYLCAAPDGNPLGTYYIQPNRPGGGRHYCNCGFITGPQAQGRGVARSMLEHALATAPQLGFAGMVFNFVLSTNTRAVAVWERYGFEVVGRVPGAFRHPDGRAADALVMFQAL